MPMSDSAAPNTIEQTLLNLNKQLLESIAKADWKTYAALRSVDHLLRARGLRPSGGGHGVSQILLRPGRGRGTANHDDGLAARATARRRGGDQLRAADAIARRQRLASDQASARNPRLAARGQRLAARAFSPVDELARRPFASGSQLPDSNHVESRRTG